MQESVLPGNKTEKKMFLFFCLFFFVVVFFSLCLKKTFFFYANVNVERIFLQNLFLPVFGIGQFNIFSFGVVRSRFCRNGFTKRIENGA